MQSCQSLNEYAWLVDKIRAYQRDLKNLEAAVDAAINDMPDDFLIKKFLLLNKAEVKGMFLTEYDQEKVLEQERRDSLKQGITQTNERVATDMLREKLPLSLITKISKLPENAIRKIADGLGVTVI